MTFARFSSLVLLLALSGCAVEREPGLAIIVPSYSYVQDQQPLRKTSTITFTRVDPLPAHPARPTPATFE